MANPTTPFGFRLVDKITGGAHTAKTQLCWVGSGDSNAIFLGDLVTINNSATHGNDAITGNNALEVKRSVIGDTGNAIVGVVVGINPIQGVAIGSENLNRVYRPASTAMYLNVCIDPDAIYEVMSDGTVAITDMGKYATITSGSGSNGSTTTGMSGMTLGESTIGTTRSAGQMYVMGVEPAVDNAINALNTIVRVRLVNTLFAT
jgi:hypothetical protein